MSTLPSTDPRSLTLSNGVLVPRLGFGTLNITPTRADTDDNRDAVAAIVNAALDVGFRHIDTAQMYENERGVGRALSQSGLDRDAVFITTKLSNASHAPADVKPAVERSLERLGVDRVDLLLMHWPLPMIGDFVSTWAAMATLVEQGLTRSIGVSNFQPAHLDRIVDETGIVPVVNQVELHPYFHNTAVVDACRQRGIAVEAWSPLGQGTVLKDPVITGIAQRLRRSTAQVILGWHLQRGHIVIPKSVSRDRMSDNLAALDLTLEPRDVAAIDALDRGDAGRHGPHPDTFDWIPNAARPNP